MRVPSTDGVTLELHDLGGEGPPLLVAHATGFCAGPYRPMAAALLRTFHVWAVDLRGHGDSTRPATGDQAWDGMAADVLACVDALGGEPIVGFGHSLGGAALLMAEVARPGLLHGAFLFEPIVFPAGFSTAGRENPLVDAARRRRPVFPSRAAALARYASRPPLGALRADALAAYVEHGFADRPDGTVVLKCTPKIEAATFEAEGHVTVDRVAGLDLPVVVAVGGRHGGEPNPARFAPALVAALNRAELRKYLHVGHFGPFQDPDTIAEDIVRWAAA